MLQSGDQWAPAALCLAVVITLGALLGLHHVDWPFVSGELHPSPLAMVKDESIGVVIETELAAPVVALTSGLPMYYVLQLGLDQVVQESF
jgi:hypothetical protein